MGHGIDWNLGRQKYCKVVQGAESNIARSFVGGRHLGKPIFVHILRLEKLVLISRPIERLSRFQNLKGHHCISKYTPLMIHSSTWNCGRGMVLVGCAVTVNRVRVICLSGGALIGGFN